MPKGLPELTVIQPSGGGREYRSIERFGVGLPFTLDGVEGQTLDLSAQGLSFRSATPRELGSFVSLTLQYGLDGHNFPMTCEAEVVRCEPDGGGFLIGARTRKPFFETEP